MSEYTQLRGTGRISTAIRELQKDAGRRIVGGPGVFVDYTTRGPIIRARPGAGTGTSATASSVVPRWG